jgi:hypothetical protein
MEGPSIRGQMQPWVIGVRVPELSGQDKTTKGLDTARVDLGRVRRGTRKQRLLKLAGVVQLALVGVELRKCSAHEQSCSAGLCKSGVHAVRKYNWRSEESQGT